MTPTKTKIVADWRGIATLGALLAAAVAFAALGRETFAEIAPAAAVSGAVVPTVIRRKVEKDEP